MELFQIAGMSTLTTERLKSSIRKVRPRLPSWPGGGRACSFYGRCDASLVKRTVRGVHPIVAEEVPYKPSECPIVLVRTGSKMPVEGLCNRLRAGKGFSLEGDWVWRGTQPLVTKLVQKRPVALEIGGMVRGLQQGPQLVSCSLANVPLDV